MLRLAPDRWSSAWPPNVWTGTTVEDQARADERLPRLAKVPACVRFLSCEPLLAPINLFGHGPDDTGPYGAAWIREGHKTWTDYGWEYDYEITPAVNWVIVGGESGPGARPFDLANARGLVDQCRRTGVACFVKQLGSNPVEHGTRMRTRDRKGGDPAEWPEDLRVREFPELEAVRGEIRLASDAHARSDPEPK